METVSIRVIHVFEHESAEVSKGHRTDGQLLGGISQHRTEMWMFTEAVFIIVWKKHQKAINWWREEHIVEPIHKEYYGKKNKSVIIWYIIFLDVVMCGCVTNFPTGWATGYGRYLQGAQRHRGRTNRGICQFYRLVEKIAPVRKLFWKFCKQAVKGAYSVGKKCQLWALKRHTKETFCFLWIPLPQELQTKQYLLFFHELLAP